MARLLVVQHEPDAPVAWLGEWWTSLGLDLDVVRGDLGEPVAEQLGGHDGLVVLGGAMGACDDSTAPWLAPTRALIADAVRREVPTLGVCLGHQLAAVALGGRVGPNPSGRTVGLVPVQLTDAGARDPLLSGLGGLVAVHYNDDVVHEAPPASSLLATLPDGRPQALRFGTAAWGVQFHPETSPEVFGAWLRWDSPDGLTDAQADLLAEVTAARDALRVAWQPLAERFAALVVARDAGARDGATTADAVRAASVTP
ncbi:MAG TPA: type 1 glutamine amidotransferase [Ornithinibacter sp.]|nr:type 1 glutamine amidotransferase [Ornithinibacter sp.]